jgi:F-type H+-transporting ATPase subunit gamma
MIAMQNATDSADRIIKDLTRVFNSIRQAKITQEIAELMGASMALEDED